MNSAYSKYKPGDGIGALWRSLGRGRRFNRGATWGLMILGALLAFEIFNFSTTQFALLDLLGGLTFAGMRWASILALAFCGIDFAGIARIFTPEQGREEPAEIWYLFGAWLLGAGFNAALTWWGVSVAIVNHSSAAAGTVVSSATLTKVIPIFVAVMIWLIRVLIIGTFSLAGDRLFSTASNYAPRPYQPASAQPSGLRPASSFTRPAPKPMTQSSFSSARPEPTYHPLGFDTPNQQRES
ncbi:MAG: hypothetical protein DYG87_09265 [Anaerolineae bacterium CFX3]|jgi:hypothetical protein|nr:hypothetical protein [Anaerolineae bacterium]MCE7905973.1 hypothetical protein [Anaerolineae bacterium CFX3]MCQ3947176.1 hypothetical protein [Anaerolineae bacterium]RIK27822.1 MAG: hypothetical protein DCC54_01925 [Anaerolineae bacterium]